MSDSEDWFHTKQACKKYIERLSMWNNISHDMDRPIGSSGSRP